MGSVEEVRGERQQSELTDSARLTPSVMENLVKLEHSEMTGAERFGAEQADGWSKHDVDRADGLMKCERIRGVSIVAHWVTSRRIVG